MSDEAEEVAATIVAIGRFIAETPGAGDYNEAVRLRGLTFEQAAEEIKAAVAKRHEPKDRRN